jgi:hypothetical protein
MTLTNPAQEISMTNRSLSNNALKNQWKEDPFDLGDVCNGVAQMNHEAILYHFTQELVNQYAKFINDQFDLSLDMLSEDDQNELLRLYIESENREIENACYGDDESINSNFICSMLAMLQNNSTESRENFAETTRKNLLAYYSKSLERILDDACNEYLHNSMNEDGFYAHRENEEGDIAWKRY